MNFIDSITPKNTKEIKPGLFVQTTARGHRVIYPAAWKGKINWYNFFFGAGFLKGFIWFLILMGLVWSYQHDVQEYQDFYLEVNNNPALFCNNRIYDVGVTLPDGSRAMGEIEVNNENTNSISNNG